MQASIACGSAGVGGLICKSMGRDACSLPGGACRSSISAAWALWTDSTGQMLWRLAAKSLSRPQMSRMPWWHHRKTTLVASQAAGMAWQAWQLTPACAQCFAPPGLALSQADSMQQERIPARQATLQPLAPKFQVAIQCLEQRMPRKAAQLLLSSSPRPMVQLLPV